MDIYTAFPRHTAWAERNDVYDLYRGDLGKRDEDQYCGVASGVQITAQISGTVIHRND